MEVKFICPECGREFTIECEHAIPGVQGEIVTTKEELHRFVDPTEPHLCDDCAANRINLLLKELKKENKV